MESEFLGTGRAPGWAWAAEAALLREGARSRSGSDCALSTASSASCTVGSCSATGSGAELVLSSLLYQDGDTCCHIRTRCLFSGLSCE